MWLINQIGLNDQSEFIPADDPINFGSSLQMLSNHVQVLKAAMNWF